MKSLTKYIQEAKTNIYISGKNKNKQAFYLYINKDKIDITPLSDGTWKYELNEPVNVTKGMFENQDNIVALDFSGFDTSNIKEMDDMFSYCKSLASLDLSNFDTSNVTDMSYMFNRCESLTSLDLSNFDTSNINYMINMFSGCSSLTSLNISNFDLGNVIDMAGMFKGCKSLKSIYMTNCNEDTVEKIKDAAKKAGLSETIVKTSH